MKPVCVPCERFMRCKRSGFYFTEGMPTSSWDGKSGKGSEGWTLYKLWVGDLFECPTCHAQTIAGVSSRPVIEHYEPGFRDMVTRLDAGSLLIKDC